MPVSLQITNCPPGVSFQIEGYTKRGPTLNKRTPVRIAIPPPVDSIFPPNRVALFRRNRTSSFARCSACPVVECARSQRPISGPSRGVFSIFRASLAGRRFRSAGPLFLHISAQVCEEALNCEYMRSDTLRVLLNLFFRDDKPNTSICNQLELRLRYALLQGQ